MIMLFLYPVRASVDDSQALDIGCELRFWDVSIRKGSPGWSRLRETDIDWSNCGKEL